MEDIIDIIVTETTNLIEITSQPTDEVIDVNIIDNREDITLNVTPSVVEININQLTGNFGILWGEIEGTLSNQTDLQNALNLKADLVDGKVPSSQLPSYVDDIVEVATYSALPAIGETGKIYVVLDTNLIYRWSGSAYIEIKDSSAVWGAITGTLSNQTDLQNALNAKANDSEVVKLAGVQTITGIKVYNAIQRFNFGISVESVGGANQGIFGNDNGFNLGVNAYTHSLLFPNSGGYNFTFPATSGTIALTSDLHNAVTLGTANGLSLSTQILSLGLASSSANGALSSTDWTTFNSKQAALSGTGFVKISGTTISYDNSTYLTTSAAASTYLALAGGTLTGALNGTSATFTGDLTISSGNPRLYFTDTDNNPDYFISNTDGTFTVYDVTNSTSRFTIGTTGNGTFGGNLTVGQIIRSGGTSSQFLKADGSVDSSTYLTTGTAASTYLALAGGTMTGQIILKESSSSTDYTKGLRFPNDPFGGTQDIAGIRLYASSGENQVFEFYIGNDSSTEDIINFATRVGGASPDNNSVKINGNTIWNAGNLTPQTQLSGTGFVKASGTTISYDNTSYLPLSGGVIIGSDSTSSNYALTVRNSTGAELLQTRNDGVIYLKGNVGIGTFSPLSATGYTTISINNVTNGGILDYQQNGTSVMRVGNNGTTVAFIETRTSTPIQFSTNDSPAMRLSTDGNLSVGSTTNTSGKKLQVYGDAYIEKATGNASLLFQRVTNDTKFEISVQEVRTRIRTWSTANDREMSFESDNAGTQRMAISGTGVVTVFNLGTGLVYSNAGALTSTNPSDSRLKADIKSITYGLNDILKLRPVSYSWKDDKVNQGIQFGFIAQEVQEVMPNAIKEFGNETKFLGLEKDAIYATLVNAIKELNKKIETLEKK